MSSTIIPPLPEIPGVRVKHIPGWPGYAVSDDGRVFSCRMPARYAASQFRHEWKQMTAHPRPVYLALSLWKGNRQKNCYVHHLVLETFVGPRPKGMECCHGKDDRANNRLSNLRWDTRQSNIDERVRNGGMARGTQCAASKLTEDSVREIRRLAGMATQAALAKRFGVTHSSIQAIVHGRTWSWLH